MRKLLTPNWKILALTPIGKARIQLENSFKKNSVEAEFMAVGQFLIRSLTFEVNFQSSTLIISYVPIDSLLRIVDTAINLGKNLDSEISLSLDVSTIV